MHSPTTAAAFDCMYRQMLRVVGKGVALWFATVQLLCLADVSLGSKCWRRRIFPRSPLCSMLGTARISPVVPRRYFCTGIRQFLSKAMNRIIAVLAHSVDKNQASFPQRSARHPASHVPVTRNVPQRSTMTPGQQVPVTRKCTPSVHNTTRVTRPQLLPSSRQRSTRHPRNTCPLHGALCWNVPWCIPCRFLSQLPTTACISQYHLPSGFPTWPATTYLPCLTSDHAQIKN